MDKGNVQVIRQQDPAEKMDMLRRPGLELHRIPGYGLQILPEGEKGLFQLGRGQLQKIPEGV